MDSKQLQEIVNKQNELLKQCLPIIKELSEETIYGGYHCDDPRDFIPDYECNSEKEIQAWEDACKRAESGETVEVQGHILTENMHIAINPFGLGISTIKDKEMCDLLDKIKEATTHETP